MPTRKSALIKRASISIPAKIIYRFAPRHPDHDLTFNWGSHNNPAGVEYTLTVPRGARLDEIKLINGSLDLDGTRGEVQASCVNGRLEAHNLSGRAELSTVNGHLEARFDDLHNSSVELESVNGSVELTIPFRIRKRKSKPAPYPAESATTSACT